MTQTVRVRVVVASVVTMQAGGEGGAREKQPSPFKKLLKRINPKKKKARKKKRKQEEQRLKEEGKATPVLGGVLQARDQNAAAGDDVKQAIAGPEVTKTASVAEPESKIHVGQDPVVQLESGKENEEAGSGKRLGLFEYAGILCAAVESIPLAVTSAVAMLRS